LAAEGQKGDLLRLVMTSPVTTMDANGTLGDAARSMVKNDIGSIVVVEGKKLVGIITERDITKQVISGENILKKAVKSVMTSRLVTATPDTPIQEAFELMLKRKIRRLPIIDNNNLIGMVTEKDLMKWVLKVSYEPNIPPHIKMILEAR
jgi:CBS domain-containing protein